MAKHRGSYHPRLDWVTPSGGVRGIAAVVSAVSSHEECRAFERRLIDALSRPLRG